MKTSPWYERRVATVQRECPVAEAAKIMRDRHVGDVVVVETCAGGRMKPVGILTDRDIVVGAIAEGMPLAKLLAQDLMADELVTARESASLEEIVVTMRVSGVRRLPVVDGEGLLVGIITADDVHKQLGEQIAGLGKVPAHQRKHENEARPERIAVAGK